MRRYMSMRVLYDQIRRNNTFKHMIEINYFEVNLQTSKLTFDFSKKFMSRTSLPYSKLEVSFEDYLSFVDPRYQQEARAYFEELKQVDTMKGIRWEAYPIHFPKAKCPMWMLGILKKISHNRFYGVHVDITELKETEVSLKNTKEEYEMILTNSTDLIAKYNPKGEIIYASPSYGELYGLSPEELKGMSVFKLEHLNQRVSDYTWFHKNLEPPYRTSNVYCFEREHDEKWVAWYNQAIFEQGAIASIISVGHDITTIKQLNQKLSFEANHDVLSGLYNRRGLREKMDLLKMDQIYTAFMISINNLQDINDFYGYEVGDHLISVIGRMLKKYEQNDYLVGRLSGAKFVIICDTDLRSGNHFFKNHLVHQLNRSFMVNGHAVYVNASIGYAVYPDDTKDFQQLLSYSELATYEAQFQANKTRRFNKTMFNRLHQNVSLSNDLRESLLQGAITLVYQGIIDAKTNEVRYIETLARWKHPHQGNIPPSEFLDIAEKSSLIENLDYYIIENALKDYVKLRQSYPLCRITINVAPVTLRSPRLVEHLTYLSHQLEIPTSEICIEVSENTFVNNRRNVLMQINRLKQCGVMVALDDFGSKYSSLAILDDVEVDIIKVDKSFIPKIPKETTMIILKMIKELADLRGKEVVIEGVETKEQVEILSELGFNLMQGYYYSIPNVLKEERLVLNPVDPIK